MPQPRKGPSLGSNPKHQRLMLSNLALSLFEHERIRTTQAKAKMLKPFAERLITKAKKGTVHHRRQVLSVIEDRRVVHKLFAEIAPRFSDRNGGYTRILKIGPRSGDAAPMAVVELVEEAPEAAVETGEATPTRRRIRRPARRGPKRPGAADRGVSDAEGGGTPAEGEAAETEVSEPPVSEAEIEAADQEAVEATATEPESIEHQKETGDEAPPDDQEKGGS